MAWVLLSGGRDIGVMDAVSKGAKEAGGVVVGILPTDTPKGASDGVDIAIITGMGSARNNINVLSSDVVIACGNPEAGTLSEVALAFKAGKPVVLLSEDREANLFPDRIGRGLLHQAGNPQEAIEMANELL